MDTDRMPHEKEALHNGQFFTPCWRAMDTVGRNRVGPVTPTCSLSSPAAASADMLAVVATGAAEPQASHRWVLASFTKVQYEQVQGCVGTTGAGAAAAETVAAAVASPSPLSSSPLPSLSSLATAAPRAGAMRNNRSEAPMPPRRRAAPASSSLPGAAAAEACAMAAAAAAADGAAVASGPQHCSTSWELRTLLWSCAVTSNAATGSVARRRASGCWVASVVVAVAVAGS